MANAQLPFAVTCTVYTGDTLNFKSQMHMYMWLLFTELGLYFPMGTLVAWAIVGAGHLKRGSSLTTISKRPGCRTTQTCVKANSALP